MNIKELSNNIRKIRVLHGLTQENVANDLGISLVAYGKIEQGKTDISYSRLNQIADYFQIETLMLFQGVEMSNVVSDSQNYQLKNPDIRRLEKEIAELKTDIQLIKTVLYKPPKKPSV
jgi:transcriptional regulator with XRE-family HTH domain